MNQLVHEGKSSMQLAAMVVKFFWAFTKSIIYTPNPHDELLEY